MKDRVEQAVEQLCQKGCRLVWHFIDALSSGREIPELQKLNLDEKKRVLAELKSIMSVYAYRCRVDSNENCD